MYMFFFLSHYIFFLFLRRLPFPSSRVTGVSPNHLSRPSAPGRLLPRQDLALEWRENIPLHSVVLGLQGQGREPVPVIDKGE